MKKLIYTLSFAALLSIAGKAQSNAPTSKQDPSKKETMKPAEPATQKAPGTEHKGTRMAITEKGVPASKSTKEQPMKEEKSAPSAVEKK